MHLEKTCHHEFFRRPRLSRATAFPPARAKSFPRFSLPRAMKTPSYISREFVAVSLFFITATPPPSVFIFARVTWQLLSSSRRQVCPIHNLLEDRSASLRCRTCCQSCQYSSILFASAQDHQCIARCMASPVHQVTCLLSCGYSQSSPRYSVCSISQGRKRAAGELLAIVSSSAP